MEITHKSKTALSGRKEYSYTGKGRIRMGLFICGYVYRRWALDKKWKVSL